MPEPVLTDPQPDNPVVPDESLSEFDKLWRDAQTMAEQREQALPDLGKYHAGDGKTPPRDASGKFVKQDEPGETAESTESEKVEAAGETVVEDPEGEGVSEDELTEDEKRETLEALAKDLKVELAKPLAERTTEEKRALLDELAKDLRFTVTDKGIAVEERAKFREEKRQFRDSRAEFERRANGFVQQISPLTKLLESRGVKDIPTLIQRVEPLVKALDAYDAGDIEGALQLSIGRTITQLNEDAIAAAGGHWKSMRALQQQREQDRAEREAEKAELARVREQQTQQERQRSHQEFLQGIHRDLSGSTDPKVVALVSAFPSVVSQVFAVESENYDPDDQSTIPRAEAASQVLEAIRRDYEKLHQIFGASTASSKGAPESPTNSESGSQPPKQAAQSRNGKPPARIATPQARREAGRKAAPISDKEWFDRTVEQLRNSTG